MTDLHLTNFDVHRDHRGILTAILNVPHQPVNVFNDSVLQDLDELLIAAKDDGTIQAIVFRSGKDSGLLAGADLHKIECLHTDDEARQASYMGQELFSRLEGLHIPTVAVINGVCLGGGLEFAMACKYRVVVDDPRTKLGLPEVELGLLPGWGGTQRLPALIGLSAALPMILTGKKVGAAEAVRLGLADILSAPENIERDVARLLHADAEGNPIERYRRDSTVDPAHVVQGLFRSLVEPHHPGSWITWFKDRTRLGQWMVMKATRRGIARNERHYPALPAILSAVSAGLHDPHRVQGPASDGYSLERDEFAKLFATEAHHSLLGLFFQRERARKSETWTHGFSSKSRRIRRIGIVGGGVMGAGIAHWAAQNGFEVVVKELNTDLLDDALTRIRDLFQESVRRRVMTEAEAASKIGAIVMTIDWKDFGDVDLAIEAVTERLDIKRDVFRDLEQYCAPHAVLASNTSALSVRAIAYPLHDPNRVFGLHFFNPVHRMQLVEVVRTEASHDDDVALLIDFVRKLGKVPVVTSDSPGFVVNRILFPYLDEAVRLHCEGVSADQIDEALTRFGMPMGPMELLDQVGIDVAAHVADTLSGLSPELSPTAERLHSMVDRGELGKKLGRGFYSYKRRGQKLPRPNYLFNRSTPYREPMVDVQASGPVMIDDPGAPAPVALSHLLHRTGSITLDDIRDRVVLRLANEAAKCVHEGVVSEPWMVDLAMVLGTGFAPFTGGPLRLCELQGYGEIVSKLEYFEKTLGPRFTPATWLIEQIEHPFEHHST